MNSAPPGDPALRGVRFAPSPTGEFHLGNLRTAWVSWRWAQVLGEPWVVRFEDIDGPRVQPGSRERQLEDLHELGMVPDSLVIQSARRERHWRLFETARASGQVYPCYCSRKDIRAALAGSASAPHSPAVEYSGHCRDLSEMPAEIPETIGWRFRSGFASDGSRDFLIARSAPVAPRSAHSNSAHSDSTHSSSTPPSLETSFTPSYHWACAIDDWDGAYRLLVRAWDLAQATPVQREVASWVARTESRAPILLPAVFHTALLVQSDGHRLEKRTLGVTLRECRQKGLSLQSVLRAFERSFNPTTWSLPIEPENTLGEDSEQIPVDSLGLL